MSIVVVVALLPHHFAAVVSSPSLTSVSYPTLTVQQYVPRRTSWRTFQMRHTEMGGRACVAGFNRYRFAWHPEMNTTAASVRACATLLASCQLLAGFHYHFHPRCNI
jgi:hypothetical protein